MSDETHTPTDPLTHELEEGLRDLPPEDRELARDLMAWARDVNAPTNSGEISPAPLRPRDVVLGRVEYDPRQAAWQRVMREKHAKEDLRTSGLTEEEVRALRGSDFAFAYVDAKDKKACKEIRAFIEKYESLQRMPNRPTHRFVARAKKDGKLAGVIVMGTGYDDNKKTWLMGEKGELIEVRRHDEWLKKHRGEPVVVNVPAQMLEKLVARGACISWSPKGLGSALIMWAIDWMIRNTGFRVFTAYSDPEAGELGTIYRNLQFKYIGPSLPSKACFDPLNPQRGEFSDKDFRRLSRYKRYARELGITWNRQWQRKTSVLWDQMPSETMKALKQAARDAEARCRVRWQAAKLTWAYVLGVNSTDTQRLREHFEALNVDMLSLKPPTERGVPPEIEPSGRRGRKRRQLTHADLCRNLIGEPLEAACQEASEEENRLVGGDGKPSFGKTYAKHDRRVRKREKRKFRWWMERCDRRVRRREKRKCYDFWRTVRYVVQRQQEKECEPFNHDEMSIRESVTCNAAVGDGADEEPLGERPMEASNTMLAAMEPLAGGGNGKGAHVAQPPFKLDTGTRRVDAPPHGGINGTRRQTIGAHPRGGANGYRLEPRSVRLSSVQRDEVRWLWTGRVPLGKIVLLDGDPDVGKTFITHDLAARVTTGMAMPFENTPTDPAGVVILSAEDGLADTIRPRIEAAGGDLDRVECFALGTLPFIPDDLTAIEEAVTRVQARLVVVDPLIAFLKVSATNDQRG